jgi:CIC family chloride channel protein
MDETIWQRSSLQPFEYFLLSILIGVVVALGAVVFGGLIALIHNLLLLGKLSVVYVANIHTAVSLWSLFVIFVVRVGAASAVSLAPI